MNKNLIVLVLALVIGGQCLGQRLYEVDPMQLVNRSPAERMKLLLDNYLFGGNTNALEFADTLKALGVRYGDKDLVWEAKFIEVLDLTGRTKPDPAIETNTVESVLTNILKEAESNNVWWLKIRMHSLLGAFYINTKANNEKGIEHFTKAAKLLEGVSVQDFPLKPYFYYQYAFMHYRFGEFRQALKWLRKESESSENVELIDHYKFHMRNTGGLCYKFLGLLDSAEYCFQQNLKLADSLNNLAWIGISSGNLGSIELARNNYEKAIPLIEMDVSIANEMGDKEMVRNGSIGLGEIALKQGDFVKARKYLYEAKSLAHELGQIEALGLLYPLLSKLETKQGNPDLAEMYLDSSLVIVEMQYDRSTSSKVAKVEESLELDRLSQSVSETQMQRNFVGLTLTVAILLSVFLILWLRSRFQNRERAIAKDKEQTETELRSTEIKLNELFASLKSKNEALARAQLELDSLKAELHTDEEREELTNKLDSIVILTEKDWRDFQILFEKAHPGVLDRLRDQIPDLTKSEVRFAALKRLSLSDREMADMLGVGTGTIRSLRSRMKPKLNLKEGVEVDDFLNSF